MNNKKNPNSIEELQNAYFDLCSGDGVNFLLQPGDSIGSFNEDQIRIYIQRLKAEAGNKPNGPASIFSSKVLRRFYFLKLTTNYMEGEGEPQTNDKDFLSEVLGVWPELISGGYYGTIYVGYGDDFLNNEKREYEKQRGKIFSDTQNKFFSKLRIYRLEKAEMDSEGYCSFTSQLTKLTGLRINPNKLIGLTCNNGFNGIAGYHLAGEYISGMAKVPKAINTASKTWVSYINNLKAGQIEKMQLDNPESFIEKVVTQTQGINNNIYKPIQLMPIEAPQIILKNVEVYFEAQASRLGFTCKGVNNKEAGVTDAENFQSSKMVLNIQQRHTDTLKVFAMRLKKQFKEVPEDFEINLRGMMFPPFGEGEQQLTTGARNLKADISNRSTKNLNNE